jgi:hypothetical protein
MGYKQDGFILNARFYTDDSVIGSWLAGDLVDRVFLAPLADDGVLEDCRYISRKLAPPTPIGSVAELRAQSSTWRYELVDLLSDEEDIDPDCEVILRLNTNMVNVAVRLGGAPLARLVDRLVPLAGRWVAHWSRTLPDTVDLSEGWLVPSRGDYPRLQPPRASEWSLDGVSHYFGQRFLKRTGDGALLDQLLREPLPSGVTREIDGDAVLLAFADDVCDAAAVARARTTHEQWISRIVPTEPERGWNAEGDRIVIPDEPRPLAPLTLYDPGPQIGYKAIVVQPDGSIDEEIWSELKALLQRGALPDGTPVASIRLIVPVRANALALHGRAITEGFEMVTYPRGEGVFWQVHPS